MNFLKPPVSVCCQILRKASDHTIVLTEKLLNYFLKSKFGSFCALSYVEKCGQSEKVVHTKERGKGWGPISTSTIVLYKYKEKHKDKCKHKDKIQRDGIQFQQQQVFLQIQTQRQKQLQKWTITNTIITIVNTIERWRISTARSVFPSPKMTRAENEECKRQQRMHHQLLLLQKTKTCKIWNQEIEKKSFPEGQVLLCVATGLHNLWQPGWEKMEGEWENEEEMEREWGNEEEMEI